MTVSIGGYTFAFADQPDSESQISFGVNLRTSQFNPEGYHGTIVTYHGQPGNKHRVHAFLGETAAQALVAIAAAQAEVVFIDDERPGLAGGVNVAILECGVDWNAKSPGTSDDADYWYECEIVMVETGS